MKVVFLSLFILLTGCYGYAQQVIKNVGMVKLLNKTNDTVDLDLSNHNGLILFASNMGCSKCYENLELFIANTPKLAELQLTGISKVNDCLNCRREFIKQYEIFDRCRGVYFNLNQSSTDSSSTLQIDLWKRFNIGRSPALGVVKNNFLYLFEHDDIFDGLVISEVFRLNLLKVL